MRSLVFEDLSIPLSSIKDGINEFDFITQNPELKLGEGREFRHPIEVHVQVTGMGDDFLLDLYVSSDGFFTCDRCNEDFVRKIEGQIQTLLTFDADKAGTDADADVRLLPPRTTEIDLQGDVIDALALAIPVKVLCQESCKGLCPQCGTNLNVKVCGCHEQAGDPRWDALKNLKFDETD